MMLIISIERQIFSFKEDGTDVQCVIIMTHFLQQRELQRSDGTVSANHSRFLWYGLWLQLLKRHHMNMWQPFPHSSFLYCLLTSEYRDICAVSFDRPIQSDTEVAAPFLAKY